MSSPPSRWAWSSRRHQQVQARRRQAAGKKVTRQEVYTCGSCQETKVSSRRQQQAQASRLKVTRYNVGKLPRVQGLMHLSQNL